MGPEVLAQVLAHLPRHHTEKLLIGFEAADDAAVYALNSELAVVSTMDVLTPVVDDPRSFGRITAANALSDVYAMGADPLLAINFVGFPQGELEIEILDQILQGGAEKLAEAGCALAGGHSVDDKELKYGLSVTGIVHPKKIITNGGAMPGDALILTKKIGTGVMAQALKAGAIAESEAAEATESMETLNKEASLCMRSIASACTDVTGFGLVGHALEMAKASGVCLEISYAKVPKLQRAEELAAAGYLAGGSKRNAAYYQEFTDSELPLNSPERVLLCDAQTSGGLLIACPLVMHEKLVDDLASRGIPAAVIGRASAISGKQLVIRA